MKIFFFLFISLSSIAQEVLPENQLLWEISGNGMKNKSYLFGSFHTNDKRVFRFSDSTYYALVQSTGIVLETDVTDLFVEWDTRRSDVRLLYDNQGKPYTATNEASATLYGNEDGMPQFLDAYFQQYCQNSNRNFYPLESVDDQLDLLSNNSDYIPNYSEFESRIISQDKILNIYLQGDIHSLDRLMKTSLTIYPGLYDDLILKRNVTMANGIDTLLRNDKLFIALGAGHLAGEKGVINLLREKGYRLRKVTSTISSKATEDKNAFLSSRNYEYVDERIGLHASLPGKPVIFEDLGETWKLIYREMGQGNTYSIEVIEKASGSLESYATDFIQTPRGSKIDYRMLDNGTWIAEGLSDTYPEGLAWLRIIEGQDHLVVIKTYGGNKYMNSKRPFSFFNSVWIDQY